MNQNIHGHSTDSSRRVWVPSPTIQELAGDETELVADLIQSFTADCSHRLGQIRRALIAGDAAALRLQVHTIKGSAKQMAAYDVASSCEQLEAACRERPLALLNDLVSQLEGRIAEVCQAMAWYQISGSEVS